MNDSLFLTLPTFHREGPRKHRWTATASVLVGVVGAVALLVFKDSASLWEAALLGLMVGAITMVAAEDDESLMTDRAKAYWPSFDAAYDVAVPYWVYEGAVWNRGKLVHFSIVDDAGMQLFTAMVDSQRRFHLYDHQGRAVPVASAVAA